LDSELKLFETVLSKSVCLCLENYTVEEQTVRRWRNWSPKWKSRTWFVGGMSIESLICKVFV